MSIPDSQEGEIPDAQLQALVSAHVDGRLTDEEAARLAARLRADPAAVSFMAGRLRFEAGLHAALQPSSRVEMSETRRVVMDPGAENPEWLVQLTRAVRIGGDPGAEVRKRSSFRRWAALGAALLVVAALSVFWFFTGRAPHQAPPPVLALKNSGFETTDLSLSASGISEYVESWQDVFPPCGTRVCDIAKASSGAVFARSGRNVVLLINGCYITQQLARSDGAPLVARPHTRYRMSGWYCRRSAGPNTLSVEMRFIASPLPDRIQYVAAGVVIPCTGEGWQRFQVDLELGADLTRPPAYLSSPALHPPNLDLTDRELHLSVDNRHGGDILKRTRKTEPVF